MAAQSGFLNQRRRPSVPVLIVIALLHLALFYGLMRAFSPAIIGAAQDAVLSSFTVPASPPPPPPQPSPEPQPDAGAQGDPGREAVPRPVTAPSPPIVLKTDTPLPKVSSTGTQDSAGAADSGAGTGAAGSGDGLGSGNGGDGRGGGIAVRPSVRSGSIDAVREFPVPPGGRSARVGQSVTVEFTVTTDGRARDCSVVRSTADAATTAKVCPLVIDKIRFNPAQRADGTPVEARYGWRQDFTGRN